MAGQKGQAGRAGRPRDPAKHEAIVDSALHLFLERGFNAATIEHIAARAGVSKVTVYNRFTDKETLFEAVVKEQTDHFAAAMMAEAAPGGDFRQQLDAYGCSLLHFLFASDHVALDRMLPLELAHHPEMAHRFFNAGPGQCRARLAELLEQARAAGHIDFENGIEAAEDLVALWKGFADVELKFGVRDNMSQAEIESRVKHGTAVFLRAYGRPG